MTFNIRQVEPFVRRYLSPAMVLLIVFGVAARFYQIWQNHFVYYDEGLYLNHNIKFLYYLDQSQPQNFRDWMVYLKFCFHAALADTKTLWFFLANMRGFFLDSSALYFTRILSAIFGSLTLIPVFLIGKKYFQSRVLGFTAAVLLAVMPSHIYYSRLGLQEALSTFLFTFGIYWYMREGKVYWQALLSGLMFAGVFFCNYRMIIIPAVLCVLEIFLAMTQRQQFLWRRWIFTAVCFLAVVFGLGSLDGGANTRITFGWMFHQAHLSKGTFEIFNLLSYPYYTFKLESFMFGVLFWGNVYFIFKKKWRHLWPWLIVVTMMTVFSLPQEKGVRYLSAGMPFMCLAVALLLTHIFNHLKNVNYRMVLGIFVLVLFIVQGGKAIDIAGYTTAYAQSVDDLKDKENGKRLISTQPVLHKVMLGVGGQVNKPVVQLNQLLWLYTQGFRYYLIDPQAYVSFTRDGRRFDQSLHGFMEFIKQNVPPDKTYTHFSDSLMERFVLEHNESLRRSLSFLKYNKEMKLGGLYVYDIQKIIYLVKQMGFIHAK